MATLRVLANQWENIRSQGSPKMLIVTESGYKVTVPFAPPSNEYSGIGQTWDPAQRPGRRNYHRRTGTKNMQISMEFFLGYQDNQKSVASQIAQFVKLANSTERVQLVYTKAEAGLYYITDCTYEVLDRRSVDHEPSRARVSMTFTFDDEKKKSSKVKAKPKASTPTAPAAAKKKTTPKPATKTARTYTVVRGDSLWKIAVKFYKNGNLWRRIADANKLKNPNLIYPGQKLRIP